jgi:hypothetical protein
MLGRVAAVRSFARPHRLFAPRGSLAEIIYHVFETPESATGFGEATLGQTFVLTHRAILAVGDYDSLTPEGCRLGAGIGLDFIEVPGLSGMGRDDAKLLSVLAGV